MSIYQVNSEYIETDSFGGYALGNNILVNERRYHSLYTFAKNPPVKRVALLKSLDLRLLIDEKEIIFSSHAFDGKECPENKEVLDIKFNSFPFPRWNYHLRNGIEIEQELFLNNKRLFLSWNLQNAEKFRSVSLLVKPLFSGHDHHSLLKANFEDICIESEIFHNLTKLVFKKNDISCNLFHNGDYRIKGYWYYNIFLKEEKNRGFDYLEDLYMPGDFTFDLSNKAIISLGLTNENVSNVNEFYEKAKANEIKERKSLEEKTRKHFIVNGDKGKTIIAGYPWFTDWGRDTFISLRGLCISVNDFETAENIILRWASYISNGMIPNRFTDYEEAEYNSVDASLWFIICCFELIENTNDRLLKETKNIILEAIDTIIENYIKGTRYNIKMDNQDALLNQGIETKALTWMDARVNENPVTSRIGKAVEIQALWINALKISSLLLNSREDLYKKAIKNFTKSFWYEEKAYLLDVINEGEKDLSFRPNQVYAIGGLPFSLLDKRKANLVLSGIEKKLLTPYGLRSLSIEDKNYCKQYYGSHHERDIAYHQGTVWGFLLGPYLEAYLRIHDFNAKAIEYVKERLKSFNTFYNANSTGQCFEIYDGKAPNKPRGCPFQAWSFAEYYRVKEILSRFE